MDLQTIKQIKNSSDADKCDNYFKFQEAKPFFTLEKK